METGSGGSRSSLRSSLADVESLERENRELKQKVGALNGGRGRAILTDLRAITLRQENKALADILLTAKLYGWAE